MRAETIAKPDDGETAVTRLNSLIDLAEIGNPGFGASFGQTIGSNIPFDFAAMNALITLDRVGLTYGYAKLGLVQVVIDQPVEDAFRGGIEIESEELDEDDLKELYAALETEGDLHAMKQTAKWARLFGGAGAIIVTEQNPRKPLNPDSIKEGDKLTFLAADRWELILGYLGTGTPEVDAILGEEIEFPYNYYGVSLAQERVIRLCGREAPSFVRRQLQGWGMSEMERCMREINSYLKFQNLLYELVDEAKIDVMRIDQFNNTLATAQGTELIKMRVQLANWIKNYKNALLMDVKDEFEQKQLSFGGLADILVEFRTNLSASLKIPVNKLFGQSSTGFSSGEDSQENYNSMIDSDVRDRAKPMVIEMVKLRCRALFGFAPEKVIVKFKPLRVLDGKDEEEVAASKQTRALELYDRDLLDGEEVSEILVKRNLLEIETDVGKGLREPISPLEMEADANETAAFGAKSKAKNDADKVKVAAKAAANKPKPKPAKR